jgi:hypothetical protein
MRAEFKYTELAKKKYLDKVGSHGKVLSNEYFFFHDIDLTQEYCEVAIECNADLKIEDLVNWVVFQSNNSCDEVIARNCLVAELKRKMQ